MEEATYKKSFPICGHRPPPEAEAEARARVPARAGNETVSPRKKARRDETVSISSRLVTSSSETVSKKNPSRMRKNGKNPQNLKKILL